MSATCDMSEADREALAMDPSPNWRGRPRSLPAAAVDEVVRQVMSAKPRDALAENRRIHAYLTRGHPVRRLHRRARCGAQPDDLVLRQMETTAEEWPPEAGVRRR